MIYYIFFIIIIILMEEINKNMQTFTVKINILIYFFLGNNFKWPLLILTIKNNKNLN